MMQLQIYPRFYVAAALAIFLLPAPVLFGWFAATAVHELCHIAMIKFYGVKLRSISIAITGAAISTDAMMPIQELFCALAGPIGGIFPMILINVFPYFALSAAIQSVYNLLPVYPLDGGRAVKCLIECFKGEEQAVKASMLISLVVLAAVSVAGVWLSYQYHLGIWPIVFPTVPLLCNMRKYSLQRR